MLIVAPVALDNVRVVTLWNLNYVDQLKSWSPELNLNYVSHVKLMRKKLPPSLTGPTGLRRGMGAGRTKPILLLVKELAPSKCFHYFTSGQ